MATFNFLPKDDLLSIGGILGSWMPDYQVQNSCRMAESLELLQVSVADLLNETKSSSDCLQPTNRWHIQIRVGNHPTYFVRVSRTVEDGGWKVNSRYGPGLAEKIDIALSWIDQNMPNKYIVRIFEVPAYYITGLTLEDGTNISVYIVGKAPGIAIELNKLYSFEELRAALVKTSPVRGVDFNRER